MDVFLTFWLQKFSQHAEKSDFLCILEGFLEILLVLLLLLLLRISKKLWGNLFGKSWIFFQNAYGILGETLRVFGEILVKASLLKRASRSHAKTGFPGASKHIVFIRFSVHLL